MLAAARQAGAEVHAHTRVVSVGSSAGRVTGVHTMNGGTYAADTVINCAGCWADDVAGLSGLRLPLAPSVGMVALTPPVTVGLSRILYPPGFHVRPDGAGRLMLGSDETDASVSADSNPEPTLPGALELVRRAARVFDALDGTLPEAVRIGIRPMPADGLSAIGPLPGLDGYYVAVTHSGVTLAPAIGRMVADEIAFGRPQPVLEPFRPDRLFSATAYSASTFQQPVRGTQAAH
jgi:glycine/D-amino acid oxidase-like deaminating enzyme